MGHPNQIGFYRDGLFRRKVEVLPGGATTITVTPDQSGTLFSFDSSLSTQTVLLPRISSNWLGLTYEFFIPEQASSDDVRINCSLDSSAEIDMALSSVVGRHSTIIPGSTFPTAVRLTAVSSIRWMGTVLTAGGYSMSSAATDNLGGWTTG